MSDLTKTILFFFVLLAVFAGCILVVPTEGGRMMMGLVAAFTLFGVARRIWDLWRSR